MKPTRDASDRPADFSLAELFRNYLKRQVVAQATGLGYAEPADEVVPYEAVPVQPVDPRLAWDNAVAVLPHLAPGLAPPAVPPDWPTLVAAGEPAVAVAFCLGNFPQMVRNLQPLLGGDLAALRALPPARSAATPGLLEWANETHRGVPALLAAGVLRLAGQFDDAAEVLRGADVPASLQALQANEAAALEWHRGQADEALASWQAQPASVPVHFNRGMAALFLGRIEDAHAALTEAVGQLPETSAWHHLGQLYLALAAGRR
jgi:tetratricopeptide (TPR) repeat protein